LSTIEFNVKAKKKLAALIPITAWNAYDFYRKKGFLIFITQGEVPVGNLNPTSIQSENQIKDLLTKYKLVADPNRRVILYKGFVMKTNSLMIILKRASTLEGLKELIGTYDNNPEFFPLTMNINWVATPEGFINEEVEW
jgi:hypothetical protein